MLKRKASRRAGVRAGSIPDILAPAADHQTAPVAPKAPMAAKDITIAGIVFQDDRS